jgi:hypothetical protein
MYFSFKADFVFPMANSLTRRALLGPAVPHKLLVRFRRTGVSATHLVGTSTVFLKTDVTSALCSHRQSLEQALHVHENGN